MAGMLSVVGTPIGNLEDVTLRALRVLAACDTVLCEDTRVTAKLLRHVGVEKPVLSYHEHSGEAKYEKVRALLEAGKHLALVTDAGTPGVSDPGERLVGYLRAELPEVRIETVPGVSALTAALSIAGMPADAFTFFGFPPHKKGRATFFARFGGMQGTVAFYESPHRIVKALTSLAEVVPTAAVCVCRELTKLHEETVTGTPAECLAYYTQHPDRVRGEFVVVLQLL